MAIFQSQDEYSGDLQGVQEGLVPLFWTLMGLSNADTHLACPVDNGTPCVIYIHYDCHHIPGLPSWHRY